MPAIIDDFATINAHLKRRGADDWWQPKQDSAPANDVVEFIRLLCGTWGCSCPDSYRSLCKHRTPA